MKRLEKEIQDRLRIMAQLRASEPEPQSRAENTPVPKRLFGQGNSPDSLDSIDEGPLDGKPAGAADGPIGTPPGIEEDEIPKEIPKESGSKGPPSDPWTEGRERMGLGGDGMAELNRRFEAMEKMMLQQAALIEGQNTIIKNLQDKKFETPGGTRAPAPVDRKIIDKPPKYNGDVRKYILWGEKVTKYINSADPRWKPLLQAIENFGADVIRARDVTSIGEKLGYSEEVTAVFQEQLHTYLDTFTDGQAAAAVLAVGPEGAFELWRRFADRGRSRRPEHVLNLHAEILRPAPATKYSELEGTINTWEYNVAYWERINPDGEKMATKQRELLLISICPKDLAEYLTKEIRRFKDYEELKIEISDWIARAVNPKGASGALGGALHSFAEAVMHGPECRECEEAEFELTGDVYADQETLLALVNKHNLKVTQHGGGKGGKGNGKNSGKARPEPTCWNCGQTGHRKDQCPNAPTAAGATASAEAAARSAARANKGDGKARGSPWQPSQAWWMRSKPGADATYLPPSNPQWRAWAPDFGKGKGKGKGGVAALMADNWRR